VAVHALRLLMTASWRRLRGAWRMHRVRFARIAPTEDGRKQSDTKTQKTPGAISCREPYACGT